LRVLQELSAAPVPDLDQNDFEVLGDLTAPLRETAEESRGGSLIDAESAATEAEVTEEAGKPKGKGKKGKKGGAPEDLSGGMFAPHVDAREMEFARIQYLQAAIQEKRESILRQKKSIDNEDKEIKRETALSKMNKKILKQNEAAIDKAQKELAKLISGYSKHLSKGFKVADAAKTALPKAEGFAHMKGFKIPEVKLKVPKPPAAPPASSINSKYKKAGGKKGKGKGKKAFVEVSSEVTNVPAAQAEIASSIDETQAALDAVNALSEDADLIH